MDIAFRGAYTKSQVINAFQQLVKPKKGRLIYKYIILVFFGIGFFYALLPLLTSGTNDREVVTRFVRYLIFTPFILYMLFSSQIRLRIKAVKNWQELAKFGEISGYVSSKGITFHSLKNTENCIPWSVFVLKAVAMDVMVFLEPGGSTIILPRAFFNSDYDWEQASELAKYLVKDSFGKKTG